MKDIAVGEHPLFLETFLNVALRNTMKIMNYLEIGKSRKFFNMGGKKELEGGEILLYPGYQANFLRGTKNQIYLRIDPAKKIVCKQTVLSKINKIYTENKHVERDEKRNIVRN